MKHYTFLENLYKQGNINETHFPDAEITVASEKAQISCTINEQWHHAKGSMHGAIFFKMLDDAAYFAAASVEKDKFLVTKSYALDFIRPHVDGKITAEGTLQSRTDQEYIASAVLKNEQGKIIGKGQGVFVKSKLDLF